MFPLNKKRRVILIIYALVIAIMCIFFVPNKIERYYSNGGMLHKFTTQSKYLPIWYNYYFKQDNTVDINSVDYSKLITQIFTASVVLGAAFVVVKDNTKEG
jgi:hypothetical protein